MNGFQVMAPFRHLVNISNLTVHMHHLSLDTKLCELDHH